MRQAFSGVFVSDEAVIYAAGGSSSLGWDAHAGSWTRSGGIGTAEPKWDLEEGEGSPHPLCMLAGRRPAPAGVIRIVR